MPVGASRIQMGLYAAIGIALLLLGVRALRGDEDGAAADQPQPTVRLAPTAGGGPGPGDDLTIHVAGAVRRPGVYRLPSGARVEDAVRRAGGARSSADANAINLAAPLADGQQVSVPSKIGPSSASASGSAAEDGPISLGSAEQSDLEEIDGIGPVTAADIIEFRDERGGVSAIEELDEVPGIGPATIEALSDRLQP